MTHKEAERSIPSFFDESMENLELAEFLDHIDKCPACREELTIQYLVGRGLQSLSDGNEFNLAGELDKKLSNTVRVLFSPTFAIPGRELNTAPKLFNPLCIADVTLLVRERMSLSNAGVRFSIPSSKPCTP